jgi:hypothetical protein
MVANGQTEKPFLKGNFLVGGSISFGYNKDIRFSPGTYPTPDQSATTKTFNFGTDINAAYFFLKHLAAGLKTEFQLSKYKTVYKFDGVDASTIKGSDNVFSIGPVIRYYTNPGFFMELFYGIYNSKDKWADYNEKEKHSLWSTSIGYSYLILNNVAVEPQIKYTSLYSKWSGIPDNETLHKIEFLIGLQIYL